MALLASASFCRAESISTGAYCVPPAPAASATAALDTATEAVAGVFMLLQPAARTAAARAAHHVVERIVIFFSSESFRQRRRAVLIDVIGAPARRFRALNHITRIEHAFV